MVKKSKQKTSGGPKAKVRSHADVERQREYLTRREREEIFRRRVLYGAMTVAAIAAVILVAAVVYDTFVVPSQALLSVDDEELEVSAFQDRVQYERYSLSEQVRAFYNAARRSGLSDEDAQAQTLSVYSSSGQQQQGGAQAIDLLINEEVLAGQVLSQMEEELIIAQQAEFYGVDAEVDEDAVQEEIDRIASLFAGQRLEATPSATPSPEPSATITPLVSPTASNTPSETPLPSDTPVPTVIGCVTEELEEGETCPTVTPLPTSVESPTPTGTPTNTATPTNTPTPLALEDAQATVVAFRDDYIDGGADASGLDEDAIRRIFYYRALREALTEYVTSDPENFSDYFVEETDIWVNSRHILIGFPQDDESFVPPEGDDNAYFEEAQQVVESLRAGEAFAPLAQAVSDDTGSGSRGGALNWSSSNGYVEGFKEAVETLPLGEISDPVRSDFGYHVIQVIDRERREVSESQLDQRRSQNFSQWLSEQRLLVNIERREGWQEFIPDEPDYNSLLGDIMPEYDPSSGIQIPQQQPVQ